MVKVYVPSKVGSFVLEVSMPVLESANKVDTGLGLNVSDE
jgi:hypothetical protein